MPGTAIRYAPKSPDLSMSVCTCLWLETGAASLSSPPQRRLGDAAKKAISKLQVRTIRKGDQETEADFDNCAVCIEGYKANDVVRILPCR